MRDRTGSASDSPDVARESGAAVDVMHTLPVVELQRMLERAHTRQIQLEQQCQHLEDVCRRQEARLIRCADLWDHAPVGYLNLDRTGMLVGVNLTAAAMLSNSRLGLAGRQLQSFADASSVAAISEFLAHVFSGWEAAVCEFVVLSSSGARHVLRMKGTADADAHECRAVLTDVTTLRQTEMRFNQLAAHIEQVYWVADRNIETFVYLSPHCHELIGADCRDFVHNPVVRQMLVHPDDLERHEAAMQAVRDGTPGEVEYRLRHPDKGLRWLRVRTFPFIENGQPMNAGLVEDITAQKQTEQSRLDDALHLRDALTREVHHRIKNNLQTVVGLLRREGSRHPHAREPILAAIAQVQSVAVVHGLSSRGGQREVNLCELLPEVVNNVSKLYGANMMHIEGSSSCAGLQIKESETVAVALILNELVSNAIKHTADEIRATDAPRVTMRRAGMHGDIRIINPGRLPLGFDFDGGVGLGTGLDLVKTLMPTSGMEIRIMQVHDDMVEVDVQIEPPVLDETTFVAPPR